MFFFDETTSLQAVQKIALPLTHCCSFGNRFIRSCKEFFRLRLHMVWSIRGIRKIRTGRRLAVLFLSKVRKLCSFFQIMLKAMLAQSRLYEKSMYTVYVIFKPREIFFNDIFFPNPVSYFCSSHLDQFAGILPCKNSPCPANQTLGGVSHPPTPPP